MATNDPLLVTKDIVIIFISLFFYKAFYGSSWNRSYSVVVATSREYPQACNQLSDLDLFLPWKDSKPPYKAAAIPLLVFRQVDSSLDTIGR